MSDPLSFGIGVAGVADAIATLQRLGTAIGATGAATEGAGNSARRGAQGTNEAANANQSFGRSAQEVAQRVQGMASQVASLSGRLGGGGVGQAAGLVASLAGVTANAVAMGTTLGPAGIVVGAISGLLPLLQDWLGANEQVTHAVSTLTEEQRNFSLATTGSISAIDDLIEAQHRLTREETRRRQIESGAGTAEEQLAAAELAGRRVGTLRQQQRMVDAQIAALERRRAAAGVDVEHFAAQGELRVLQAQSEQLGTQIQEAHEESQRLGALAASAQALADASERQQREEEIDRQQRELGDRVSAKQQADAQHHGAGAQASDAAARGSKQGAFERMTPEQRRDLLGIEDTTHAAVDAAMASFGTVTQMDELLRGIADTEHERSARAVEDAKRAADAQHELVDATITAQQAFEQGYVNSLDQVISRYRELERAARASGTGVVNAGRLMERGMVAVGNNIAETVGGTMKSAFESALGAWLDGSKSFVEAAEAMAKGVLKALVTEAIVQGVVELARGIADLAGYHYDSAALHFAAAGAWAAVGAVAGGVGAAVGAFGGGSQGTQPGSTRDTASADRERQQQQSSGPVTFNVYPGGFITKKDMQAAMIGTINEAEASGYRIRSRAA